eukprot:958619-Pyramimonas_sp.AAC.1
MLILRPPPREFLEFDVRAESCRAETEQLAAELGVVLPTPERGGASLEARGVVLTVWSRASAARG